MLPAGLLVRRRHKCLPYVRSLGRRRILPDVRGASTCRCWAHAKRSSLHPGRAAVHELCYSRKGGHAPDHGIPPRRQRACTRSDHNAVKPGRCTFHAGERSDRTQTRGRPNASTWFHSARHARLRSLLSRTRDGDARVRLLRGSSATTFGHRVPAPWTAAGRSPDRRKVMVVCGHRPLGSAIRSSRL